MGRLMTSLFRTPRVTQQIVKPPEPAPVPTVDDGQRSRIETERLRRRRGTKGNIHTSPLGAVVPATHAQPKTLMGE